MIGKAINSAVRKANEAALAASFARYGAPQPAAEPLPPPKSGKTYRVQGLMPDLSRFYEARPASRGVSGTAEPSYSI